MKPGYKQSEVGIIPENWEAVPIGSIASFTSGQAINIALLAEESSDTPIPVYGGNGIAGYTTDPLIPEPTVVVGRVGQKCGEVYLTEGPAWVTDNALYPRCFLRKPDVRFLASAMKAAGLNRVKNRNDLPLVTQAILHSVVIPLPANVSEQRAIATALSDVDALLDRLERLIAKKRDLKQAATQQLLTGQTRLPGVHGEWAVRLFGSLVGRTFPKSTLSSGDGLESGSFPLFVSGGEPKRTEVAQFQDAEALVFSDGGVFGVRRAVGRFSVTDHCLVVALRKEVADMRWFEAWFSLHSQQMDRLTFKGSGLRNLDKPSLRDIEIRCPDIGEQSAIAAVLSDMDAELSALDARRDRTCDLRQAMMQELLTGRKRLIAPEMANA